MRVISGKLKGRNLKGFDIDGTRPTQDRVKMSLFGMIQNYVENATVLDLFAGSGSLGIETLSNNCSYCYFVDNNIKSIETIKDNLKNSDIKNYKTMNNNYNDALNYFKNNKLSFDIIFLDPPYDLDCIDKIISFIVENNLLNSNGIIVCEFEHDNFNKEYARLTEIKYKKYGYKFIRVYKNIVEESL